MKSPGSFVGALAGALLLFSSIHAQDRSNGRRGRRPEPPGVALPASFVEKFEWQSIGPANMSGRIVDLAVHEDDPSTFWIATASGGLLKTVNAGITFEHQFDRETTVSIGAIDVARTDPSIVWVGTGENNPRNSVSHGDGVYKSTDGGETWTHMGLRESFQIGDLVIHPSDPDTVYVGALGRLYGPNEERGLFKTTDGGKSWNKIHFVDAHTGVIDIAMHPEDPDTLLVATYERERDGFDTNDPAKKIAPGSGVWRTADGGKTFEKITAGLPSVNLGRIGFDWYRKDPNVVFAVVESELIGKPGANVGWAGVGSEDAETGAKVTVVLEDGPGAAAGLEVDDIVLSVNGETVLSDHHLQAAFAAHAVGEAVQLEVARDGESLDLSLALAERPADDRDDERSRGAEANETESEVSEEEATARRERQRRRSATLRNPFSERLGGQRANQQALQGKQGHEHGGLYRSDDGGATWSRINTINPRPMYFSQVRVDPNDDQRLYVLGVSMSRSKDGGETFTSDAGRGIHADQHALWIDPNDGRHMIVGTDGGAYVTRDRCEHWAHLNHVALGQFYHVAVGPRRDYWVYGGLQDNGTWGAPRRGMRDSGTINEDWIRIGGGDGFVVRVDANDPDQIYYESQNGGTARTHLTTMEGGRIRPETSRRTRYRFNWQTPFVLSHHNSRIYYSAGNHVFRSLDRGNDLVAISPDITRTDRGSATALAESPRDPDVLYVGSDDGALHRTKNGGHEWTDLFPEPEPTAVEASASSSDGSNGGPSAEDGTEPTEPAPLAELIPGPRWVSSIEPSRYVDGRVYLTLDGHRSDDDDPHVLVSEDYGDTWRSLRADLPRGSTRVIREDIRNRNLLWLGTEFGLYVSTDRGESWTRFHGSELPTVAIHEIAQHEPSGEVVLATHGRSLWVLDATPLRQLTKEALEAPAHLLEPSDVVVWQRRHRRGSSNGASRFVGDNPDNEAAIWFHLASKGGAKLSIRTLAGDVVHELETPEEAGLHRVDWDLRRAPTEEERARMEEMRRQRGGRFGRWRGGRSVGPGTYKAVLEVGGETHEQSFEVLPDPNAPPGASSRFDDEEEDEERDEIDR